MKPVIVLRHVAHEGLGTIADALERGGLQYTIVDAFAGPLPKFDLSAISGLIVMGGPMNVDQVDRYPALAEEVVWLQQAVAARLPVLGVCLGSQLLAKALGAKVYANRIKEIGWYEVELLAGAAEDRLFGELVLDSAKPSLDRELGAERQAAGCKIKVFQWHGDTFDLPQGAVQLARSEQCENQAFRFGDTAYGLQFHMEVTQAIIDDWLCEGGNCGELAELSYIDPDVIRGQTPEQLPRIEALGGKVFDRFVTLCRACQ